MSTSSFNPPPSDYVVPPSPLASRDSSATFAEYIAPALKEYYARRLDDLDSAASLANPPVQVSGRRSEIALELLKILAPGKNPSDSGKWIVGECFHIADEFLKQESELVKNTYKP